MTGLWLGERPLVLGSGSATRRLLLESAGVPVVVRPARVDERAIEAPLAAAGVPCPDIAAALARAKALDVAAALPGALVIGADQTLSLGLRSFHKPRSAAEARDQIAALSGATHHLDAAVVLVRDGEVLFATVARASLTMRPLSPDFIDRYVAVVGDGVRDSVGAYKLEGLGIHLFERIEGDHSTVLGLPLLPVLAALRGLGMLAG